jgi:hypothetical protein
METNFKPKDTPNEYLKFGIYFKSENDNSTQYLIKLCEGRFEGNALVKIYTTGIFHNHFETDGLKNGLAIGLPEYEVNWIADIDLCGKYFSIKFKDDLQLYYDDEKYYGYKTKTNSITSLMECINYAIEYGLNKSGIKPY